MKHIKPLLRILPSLSGNVQLACKLTDIQNIGETDNIKLYESNIREAKLFPLSSFLWQKNIRANLLSSSWEYDLPKFYTVFSDIFYDTCFKVNKSDIMKLDKHQTQNMRARDFEFGVKRVPYSESGYQFAFFAPIYIDDVNYIPDYFQINVLLYHVNDNGKILYAVNKKLRVNIGINKESKKNYIYKYLHNYAKKLNNDVAFCTPITNQATYYGIDLIRSGFVTAIDNMMERIYRRQNTIHNFDATIAGAFKRNNIAMKQIIPLCYYFNVNDLLTDAEKIRYRNCRVEFTGGYYHNGNKLDMYDFLCDYTNYKEEILAMDPILGDLQWTDGYENNIMDTMFPSLNETRYINYEYTNKLAPWYCRWKLKYTDDEHPYIINNSWAFSNNQDSNYKYGQFPSSFHQILSLARCESTKTGNTYYNLLLPIGEYDDVTSGRSFYSYAPGWQQDEHGHLKTDEFYYLVDRYRRIIDDYCANWFTVIPYDVKSDSGKRKLYNDKTIWEDVDNGCVYYNGILYDLRNIYNATNSPEYIDKFAVILRPYTTIFDKDTIRELCFSRYTLYRGGVSTVPIPNATVNDSILHYSYIESQSNFLYENDNFDYGKNRTYQDEIKTNEIFKKNPDNNGRFIDTSHTTYTINIDDTTYYGKLDLDYYDINKYYSYSDIEGITYIIKDVVRESYNSLDDEFKEMVYTYVMPHYGYFMDDDGIGVSQSYVNNSYLFVPIYRMENFAYDPMRFKDENDIKKWLAYNGYTYTYEGEVTYFAYHLDLYNIQHNESVLRFDSSAYNKISDTTDSKISDTTGDTTYNSAQNNVSEDKEDKLFKEFYTNAYVRTTSNYYTQMNNTYVHNTYTHKSNIGGKPYIYNYSYSYLTSSSIEYNDTNYGVQLYYNTPIINSTYIPYLERGFDGASYLSGYNKEDVTNHTYLFDWENQKQKHPGAYWAGCLSDWKHDVSDKITEAIKAAYISEYEFLPVLNDNGFTHARNIFIERSSWTGKFYGDAIPLSEVNNDIDVLWCDEYNLEKLFEKAGSEKHGNSYLPKNYIDKELYVKFLNKHHIFYWFIELYKDKDLLYNGTSYYTDFTQEDWYKYLYVVETKLMYDTTYTGVPKMSIPKVRNVYTPLASLLQFPEYYKDGKVPGPLYGYRSFLSFYNSLKYDASTGLFTLPGFLINDEYRPRYEYISYSYTGGVHYEPIKFELVFKKKMYRVDEALFNISHLETPSSNYCDLYFYRLQSNIEQDTRYNHAKKIDLSSDLSYVTSYLEKICYYSFIDENNKEQNNGFYGEGDDAWILTDNGFTYIQPSDSMLIPMFDDIFIQPYQETVIYAHYTLHDIAQTYVVADKPNTTGDYEIAYTNYRYNKPNKLMFMNVSDEEFERYNFTETYDLYDNCNSDVDILDDDLNYSYYGLSTKIGEDGTRYGFYYINSYINNTSNTFNVSGIIDKTVVPNLKYISYINNVDINENKNYMINMYKHLLPFINQQPYNVLSYLNTVVYPKVYPIDLIYSQTTKNYNNKSSEVDIIKNPNKLHTLSLLRYFHAMSPLIVPTSKIDNEWRLKLKDVDAQMLDTGQYISIGDAPIYKDMVSIDKFTPYKVYSTSYNPIEIKNYNNVTSLYTPLEYKFYNNSIAINLEPYFEIKVEGKMKYNELLSKETRDFVIEIFEKRVNNKTKRRFNRDEILFLLNKYDVRFKSTPVSLNINNTEKLYTLKVVFTLL